MAYGETIVRVRSLKGTHFTGALAQNVMENESLTIPDVRATSTFLIHSISIQADQQLDFSVIIWDGSEYDNTDLDLDTFLFIHDFTGSALTQEGAAGQFYGSVALASPVPYRDGSHTDATAQPELHCALLNKDATGKNAGATGEVVITVMLVAVP